MAKVKKAKSDTINTIRRAMKSVVKNGNGVDTGRWGAVYDQKKGYFVSDGEGACALGALLIYKNGSLKFKPSQGRKHLSKEDSADMAAYVLGVDKDWVSAFIQGFDGDGPDEISSGAGAVRLDDGEFVVEVEDDEDGFDTTTRPLKPKKDLDATNQERLRAFKMGRKLAEEFA